MASVATLVCATNGEPIAYERYAALSKGLSAREDLSVFGAALQAASGRKG